MPRYFFHLRCEDTTVPDSTGADLRDPDHAFEAARSMARNLMSTQSDAGGELARVLLRGAGRSE